MPTQSASFDRPETYRLQASLIAFSLSSQISISQSVTTQTTLLITFTTISTQMMTQTWTIKIPSLHSKEVKKYSNP
jgi:hypothetical protein